MWVFYTFASRAEAEALLGFRVWLAANVVLRGIIFFFSRKCILSWKKSCVPLVINYVKSKVGPHESSQFPCENFQQRYTGSYSHTNMPGKENWKWPTVAKEQRLGEKLCRCPSVFRPQLSLWPFLFNIVAGGCNLSVGTACAICKNP